MIKIIDYHVHTTLSDGILTPEDIVETARKLGLEELCITDHFSHSKIALSENELGSYYDEINQLKGLESSIEVFAGLEVDLYSIRDFDPITSYEWDFILFEYVFFIRSEHVQNQVLIRFLFSFAYYVQYIIVW